MLGSGVGNRGVLNSLADVIRLLDDVPGLLHFACHNAFKDDVGSSIMLDGGPWTPSDLAVAVQLKAMADASPLVFFNACRSAGEAAWLSEMAGWAKQFINAGAGAFIGSLWAVRSSTARTFAETFYQAFVRDGEPLGAASLHARHAIADEDGDPTWLAYTVYGNPAALAAR
jgi:CHAT domain-containing protein